MNPSASDWISKFLDLYSEDHLFKHFDDAAQLYEALRSAGFAYGLSQQSILGNNISSLKLTKDEFTKVNLFHALLYTYYIHKKNPSIVDGINECIKFYKSLDKGKTGFLKKLSFSQKPTHILEQIMSARLYETNHILRKNTISIFTYAFLYIDIVAFDHWLKHPKTVKLYASEMESSTITCCYLALKSKAKKNKYDRLLIELFESSSNYLIESSEVNQLLSLKSISYLSHRSRLEKQFILDLCCIAVWDDHTMDESELLFLKEMSAILVISEEDLALSINQLLVFSEKNTKKVSLFEYANPVKQFYKQSTATVKLLILRNKNRLLKELDESGELVVLLGQSAIRELSEEEKDKVKNQLLDICKTIPSLTIFLLPGGTILLPLLVKFIPKLLPSAFDENRVKKKG